MHRESSLVVQTRRIECLPLSFLLFVASSSTSNQWHLPLMHAFSPSQWRDLVPHLSWTRKCSDANTSCFRDASTPTHDFLVTPHPHCDGLYVASGGSFHGWKFLPVIGDYVADMMHGDLASEYAERWAWDKKTGDGHSANPTYKIIGDLQDWL